MSGTHYDYIIVGAGTAGCVLAHRLSESGTNRVLLLEAGPRDRHPLIHVPLGMGRMNDKGMFDWGYQTEPEPNLNGRRIEAMRGKVLGGSSAINVMAYTRGNRGDYDRWAQKGALGWSYSDILPYFKRTERWQDGENTWRGGSGHLGTEWAKTTDPLYPAWVEAGKAAGFPFTDDYNGRQQEGFGRGQYTIRDGRRSSSARAYLRPARQRRNLEVMVGVHVTKLVLQGTSVRGVECHHRGQLVTLTAEREVILASGTFNTPQLLMLSGIGPADHLCEVGIKPVIDLPVGDNLQDHLGVWLMYTRPQAGEFHHAMRFDRMALAMVQAYLFGSGPGTVVPGGLHAFVKMRPELAVPDIEFMFRSAPLKAHLWFPGVVARYLDGFGIRPTLLHPESRGNVRLRSADPRDPPRITYDFFTVPGDMTTLVEGVRRARDVMYQPQLDPYRGTETMPGVDVKTDAQFEAWIRKVALTAHHPAGTCKMGTDPEAVVDPQLRVRGIEHLRVVDASVMPDMVSAHINACVFMIAEKGSDMILGNPPLPAITD